MEYICAMEKKSVSLSPKLYNTILQSFISLWPNPQTPYIETLRAIRGCFTENPAVLSCILIW